jgi:2-polyprenyl-6-methoxyphenol hydroxylase-like FAD-dependent oxidoreductase
MYDVIVVGARCAGSPTALLLSRAGYKVLLVDKASFPSDKPLSTHLLIRPACAVLKRLGLLEPIKRTGVVSASEAFLDMHNPRMSVIAQPPACDGTDESLAPRRYLLDQILLEAALAAGAELRSECVLDALLFEDNRVVGARCHDLRTGTVFEESARIVIGADGLNSRVARSVNAPLTHYVPTQSGVFFGYFSDLPLGNRLHLFSREDRFLTAYPTNDGLSIVVDYFPVDAYQDFHADIERSFYDDFKRHVPEFYERLVAGKRESRFLGTCHQPNYFGKCYGARLGADR